MFWAADSKTDREIQPPKFPKRKKILVLPYLGVQSKIVTKQLKTCIKIFYGCIDLSAIFQSARPIKSFLVVDTRSVETTIAVGQNMQMCHSLRCKQIDRSTGTQLISIQWRRGPFLRESLILARSPQATNIWSRATEKEKRSPVQATSFRLVRTSERIETERNETKRNFHVHLG